MIKNIKKKKEILIVQGDEVHSGYKKNHKEEYFKQEVMLHELLIFFLCIPPLKGQDQSVNLRIDFFMVFCEEK